MERGHRDHHQRARRRHRRLGYHRRRGRYRGVGDDLPRSQLRHRGVGPPVSISLEEPGALPRQARVYVALVIATGTLLLALLFPRMPPPLVLFVCLLLMSCVTSAWKINLPISLVSG